MFFYRAGVPGWMEMIKRKMEPGRRGRIFSLCNGLSYAEGVVLSLAAGALLDQNPGIWKALFAGAAIVGMGAVAVQSKVEMEEEAGERGELKEVIVRPWRDSWQLLRGRRDFAAFQWGFMLAGFGIMLIQPALPMFAVDDLGVSYLEVAGAVSVAKGLGFSLSSWGWARGLERLSLFRIASLVFLSVGLFPAMLALSSVWGIWWFFGAYFWYGVGQGGSHLVWNMSGPIFAGKEESSKYTGVGVVLAGLRGAVGPPLGGLLAGSIGAVQVMILGGLFCIYSGIRMFRREERISSQLKEG